jgi:hypothetical protein
MSVLSEKHPGVAAKSSEPVPKIDTYVTRLFSRRKPAGPIPSGHLGVGVDGVGEC